MNERHDNDAHLLWQLRGLRREQAPGNDLWPGIAARIAAERRPADGNVVPLRRRGAMRLVPWALAATLALALGAAWQLRPASAPAVPLAVAPATAPAFAPGAGQPRLAHREAQALTLEYAAALRELKTAGTPAPAVDRDLRQLDRSAEQIRTALARDPDAHFLLDRLRRTYEKRLELTQRATLS